tara:strand:+ start:10686 stop:10988 length:303 start_codon:yes stop_codon:yes gene_type:complete
MTSGAKVTDATHPPAAANLPSPPSSSEEGKKESKEEKKEEGKKEKKEEEEGKEPKLYIRIPKKFWNEYTPKVSIVALLFLSCNGLIVENRVGSRVRARSG